MFIDDAVTLMANAGLGVKGTSIFWSSGSVHPTTSAPVAATGFYTLVNIGGMPPIIMHNSEQTPGYVRPEVQITARAKTWGAASAKALAAWTFFSKNPSTGKPWRDFFVGSIWYVSLDVKDSEVIDLGPDAAGLIRAEFEIRCEKRPGITTGVTPPWIQESW